MLNNRVKLTNKEVRRWWAPEVFGEQKQTKEADVWSFGVLMWEVCTFGGLPYSNINIDDIQDHIKFDRQVALVLRSGFKIGSENRNSGAWFRK